MSEFKPINVGFISYGHSTRTFHLPFILPNPAYRVVAFLQRHDSGTESRTGKPAPHCEEDFPEAKRYRTANEFFADQQIDLVVVASHGDTHGDYAIKALEAGMHVVVEKPFCVTSAECDKVIEAAKKTDKLLTVYQNRRYDSDFLTLQSLMAKDTFGRITEFEVHYDVDSPPSAAGGAYKPGDGLMFGVGVHIIDSALVLFGNPASVTGFYRTYRGARTGTDNGFTIILQYDPDGPHADLVVTVKGTSVSRLGEQLRFLVRGTGGSYVKYGEDPQANQMRKEGKQSTHPDFGVEDEHIYGTLTTTKRVTDEQVQVGNLWEGKVPSERGSYHRYYEDLAAAIRGERALVVKPEESRAGIRIVELARESAETGRTLAF